MGLVLGIGKAFQPDYREVGQHGGVDRLDNNIRPALEPSEADLADAYDSGCRSVIINTDPEDTPIQWYRREGFTDEVYWHRSYMFEPHAHDLR